jgi:hypothetical protein
VAEAEGNEPATAPMPPGTPGDLQPPAQPLYGGQTPWGQVPGLDPNRIQWRAALPGAAVAGLLGGGVSLFVGRFLPLLLLALMLAGALAVRMYRARTRSAVRPLMGAKLGVFAGLFSFLLYSIVVVGMFTMSRPMIQENMREAMKVSSRNVDPQSLQTMQALVDKMNTPEGLMAICVLILLSLFVITMMFTALGGALGAAMFGKDHTTA